MNKRWYRCKGRDTTIFKPDGCVVSFWISGTDEDSVRKHLTKKGVVDIEYIREDKIFPKNL